MSSTGKPGTGLKTAAPQERPHFISRFREPSARKALPFLVFAVASYLLLLAWGGWADALQSASRIGPIPILISLALSLLNYAIRSARWHTYLRLLSCHLSAALSARIYLSGLALTATPGRLGEVSRAVFLKPYGVSFSQTFVLFFWDRFSDLLGVLGLAVLTGGLLILGYELTVPTVVALVAILWFARPGGPILHRLAELLTNRSMPGAPHLRPIALAFRAADERLTKLALFLSVIAGATAYAAHGVSLFVLAGAAGVELTLTAAMLVLCLSILAGVASMIPGGIGAVEASMAALLMAQGAPVSVAVAISIASRVTTFWFASAIGLVCFVSLTRGSRRDRLPT